MVYKPTEKKEESEISRVGNSHAITHTNFMNFIEPFFEPVNYSHYNELVIKSLGIDNDINALCEREIVKKLLCLYRFRPNIKIPNVTYHNKLMMINRPRLILELPGFIKDYVYQKKVDSFFELRERLSKVMLNNQKIAKAIKDLVKIRSKAQGYFQIYGLIQEELETIYKKISIRQKKRNDLIEMETINEYLKRMEKFFDIFGPPEQFPFNYYIYPDVLKKEAIIDLEKEFEIL